MRIGGMLRDSRIAPHSKVIPSVPEEELHKCCEIFKSWITKF
ncbi:hypothetical protein F4555_000855 [Mobiluncus mulieris]|uniref:Uncharacterized protein n=1 Tax=Mobiluncus mulieris TaxID=2052 RepID=A0A2X1SDB3_9ACTO|nr:hypothetical protein [Mobiluncus mulieris]SPX75862.1 Uncharacterised protein [Mobiluncus mulieris]STO17456.1 Uncharacterised protein [Mobiluncus mulieris]STY84819.1 Uncharacterised protein [Mobiluncus mulieris]